MKNVNRLWSRACATVTCIIALITPATANLIADFDDLEFWGTGTNQSAIVIDWNDGKSNFSLAWGFRWDGTLTVADMLSFLAANDERLLLRWDSQTIYGPGLFGIGYQTGESPFGVTGAQDAAGDPVTPEFVNGVDDMNVSDTAFDAPASSASTAPLNTVDRYKEGWNDNGIWGLYLVGDVYDTQPQFTYPEEWTSAWVGVGGANLTNNGWYGLSFAPGYSDSPPSPVIPEPGFAMLFLFGTLLLLRLRKVQAK